MALEDYLEPEVAVAAVVAAAVFSPRSRKLLRRGAVYGMAGALKVGDAVTAFTHGLRQGVQEAGTSPEAQPARQTKAATTATEAPAESTTSEKTAETAAESAGD
jgi:hypothetical protein